MRYLNIIIIALIAMSTQSCKDETFRKEVFIGINSDTLRYRIMLPEGYRANQKYPLVLFLHGAGERGSDNEAQLVHGSSLFAAPHTREQFPAIVVFPQCPLGMSWYNGLRLPDLPSTLDSSGPSKPMGLVIELIESLIATEAVDQDRVYVMGLSMGGFGTFDILSRRPELFAAGIPICGGGDTSLVASYAHIPLWIFHGALDDVVVPEFSRSMVEALRSKGATVKYTEFPNADHNSWDPAFAQEGLLEWLFEQRR